MPDRYLIMQLVVEFILLIAVIKTEYYVESLEDALRRVENDKI